MPKVLSITLEPISKLMAGPAIRCFELSRQLAHRFDVMLASPADSSGQAGDYASDGLRILSGPSKRELYEQARDSDILFIQANVLKEFPLLAKLGKYIVADLYDPYLLSLLAQYAQQPATAQSSYRLMHHTLERHLKIADFSICASERQRDYWLGRYCSIGRLTPQMHLVDPTGVKLIDVVPFGVPSSPATVSASGGAIKGKIPGIYPEDQVLFWGGGIWEWFDPRTIIEAVALLKDQFPRLRLLFGGWKSPNPSVPPMKAAQAARDLADQLKLLDTHVFFYDNWIPYASRANFLLDCDIAVSAHFDLLETRFSYRTRILDYLWAGRPIITTGGDHLSQLIEQHGCGTSVGYKDVGGWVQAIVRLLSHPEKLREASSNSHSLAQQFTWNKVAAPLVQYCNNPYHLPAFCKIVKPSLAERAMAVYERGGVDLVIKRSRGLIDDIIAG